MLPFSVECCQARLQCAGTRYPMGRISECSLSHSLARSKLFVNRPMNNLILLRRLERAVIAKECQLSTCCDKTSVLQSERHKRRCFSLRIDSRADLLPLNHVMEPIAPLVMGLPVPHQQGSDAGCKHRNGPVTFNTQEHQILGSKELRCGGYWLPPVRTVTNFDSGWNRSSRQF